MKLILIFILLIVLGIFAVHNMVSSGKQSNPTTQEQRTTSTETDKTSDKITATQEETTNTTEEAGTTGKQTDDNQIRDLDGNVIESNITPTDGVQ